MRISWNPSLSAGSLYLAVNPENAIPGSIGLFSGLKRDSLSALTVSLCLHTATDVVKQTQRIGTLTFLARSTHLALVSGSALVLSIDIRRVASMMEPHTDDYRIVGRQMISRGL